MVLLFVRNAGSSLPAFRLRLHTGRELPALNLGKKLRFCHMAQIKEYDFIE